MTRLVLIAAAGLDWGGFDAGTRSESLPALAALRRRGFACALSGSPAGEGLAAFASLVTGVEPETHGVWRSQETWGGGVRPTGRSSWRATPIWARLEAAGVTTGSVGWPGIAPGADWAGVHLDQTFAEATGKTATDWALPLRCAPLDARDAIALRRVHPTQITTDMIRGFAPDVATIDQNRPSPLPALAIAMARAATIQGGAVWLLTDRAPSATFIFHGILAQARRAAEGRVEPGSAYAAKAAWRFLDSLFGKVAEVAGQEALVLVVSPGWRGRPGVVVGAGPAVKPSADLPAADILDIAPTLLGLFGLEDPGLAGRRLERLSSQPPYAQAPSPPLQGPVEPDRNLLRIAEADGYAPPPPVPAAWRAQGLAQLGQMLLRRAPAAAESAAAEALGLDSSNALALRVRATALFALEQAEGLIEMAVGLERAAPNRGWGALARGAYHILRHEPARASPWLLKAEADRETETLLTVASGWLMIRNHAATERVLQNVLKDDPENSAAEIGMAIVWMARRDFIAAEAALRRALAQDPARAEAYEILADVYHETGRKAWADSMSDIARRLQRRERPS
jgi:tetratricopeptide (TPR) repeat protein